MSKKNKISIYGYDALIEEIQKMGTDGVKVWKEAVELSGTHATTRYKNFIKEHNITGLTESSIVTDLEAEYDGEYVTLQTGFNVDNGGLPAIYLDRGTPKQKPTNFIRKIKKELIKRKDMEYVIKEAWKKARY